MVKFLVNDLGCDPKKKNNRWENALHYASYTNNLDMVKFLVNDCGVEVTNDVSGHSPLYLAEDKNVKDFLKSLSH